MHVRKQVCGRWNELERASPVYPLFSSRGRAYRSFDARNPASAYNTLPYYTLPLPKFDVMEMTVILGLPIQGSIATCCITAFVSPSPPPGVKYKATTNPHSKQTAEQQKKPDSQI